MSASALSKLLQTPLIHLIDERRHQFEKRSQIPRWWINHVERFALSPDRLTRPESGPPLLALVYWSLILLPFLYDSSSIRIISLCITIPLALCVSFLAHHRKMEVSQSAKLARAWTTQHFLFPPTSLFFFGREIVAWWLWESGGRRWTREMWNEQQAILDMFEGVVSEIDSACGHDSKKLIAFHTLFNQYTVFARDFRNRYRTASPYFVDREGEELRLQLLRIFLTEPS